jgi:hypothetical protein
MKRQTIVYGLTIVLAAAIAFVLMIRATNCAKQAVSEISQAAGLPGWFDLLSPGHNLTKPSQPSIVPPGHSARPSASRRPVFGTERTKGTEITLTNNDGHGLTPTESLKVFVGEDGTVRNLGRETLSVKVTRVGPAFIEWDVHGGIVVLGGLKRDSACVMRPLATVKGYAVDGAVKLKLLDVIPVPGLEIGLPIGYLTTSGPGVGFDVKLHALEHVALDGVWLPMVRTWAAGLSINW